MRYLPKRPARDPCPVETVTDIVGGKWKARILLLLRLEPCNFAALRRQLPGISQQVLATQLASLMEADIVSRGRGESESLYRLTEQGSSLMPVLDAMARWGEERLRAAGRHWNPPAGFDRLSML